MTRLALEPLSLTPLRLGRPTIDPLALSAARAAATRSRQQREVTPEEERSLLGSILGGVEYIGSTLDKPGAAVRGVVHGLTDVAQGEANPDFGGGLLNLIPFSDTMGITNREERVSGRDVLENVGLAAPNKPGLGLNSINPTEWDWQNLGGDVAGFGAEVVMDPHTWITGPLGTILKGAGAAEKATPVAKAVAEAAARGEELPLSELAKTFKEALPFGAKKTYTLDEAVKAGGLKNADALKQWQQEILSSLSPEELSKGSELVVTPKIASEAGLAPGFSATLSIKNQTPKLQITKLLGTGGSELTPVSMANQIRAGERGLVGIKAPKVINDLLGLPDAPLAQLGAGKEWAAKTVENLAYSPFSPISGLRGIFGYQTAGTWGREAQMIADTMYGEKDRLLALMEDMYPTVVRERDALMDDVVKAAAHTGMEPTEVRRAFDEMGRELILENPEKAMDPAFVRQEMWDKLDAAQKTGDQGWLDAFDDMHNRFYEYYDTLRNTEDAMGRYVESLGINFKWLEDEFVDHFGRRPSAKLRGDMEFRMMRAPYLRDMPGGSVTFNHIGRDPLLTATKRVKHGTKKLELDPKQLRQDIAKKYADPSLGVNVARKPAQGTRNQYNDYLKSIEGTDAADRPWLQTMIPHPDDSKFKWSSEAYQKRYAWDFHLEPAIRREAYKRGLNPADTEALVNQYGEMAWFGKAAEEGKDAVAPKLDELIKGFSTLPESVLKNGLFDRSTATDYFDYMHAAVKSVANQGYLHSALKQPGIMKLIGNVDELGPGESQLITFWHNNGLTNDGLRTLAVDSFLDDIDPAMLSPAVLDQVKAMRGQGMTVNEITEALGQVVPEGKTIAQAEKMGISAQNGDYLQEALNQLLPRIAVPDATKGLVGAVKQISSPKVESKLLKFFDQATAFWKGNVTIPFASFHVRNLGSAVFQMASDGKIGTVPILRGLTNAYKQILKGDKLAAGEGLQHIDEILSLSVVKGRGWIEDVSSEETFSKVADLFPQGPTGGIATALSPKRMRERTEELFGAPTGSESLLTRMGKGIAANLNPLASRGVMDNVPRNVLQDAGEKAYNFIETMVRAGYYDELRKAGYSPSQSLHLVNRAHFDYSKLNNLEKTVFRRAMPFYAWTRKSLPYTMAKMLEHPGGMTSQAFRAVNRGEEQEGVYTPAWMREQIAAPVTGTPEDQTFIRSFGLPIEDYNRFVIEGGLPNTTRTLQTFGSNLHPAATTLIEQISGKQLYSGRDLKTLESPTEDWFGTRIRPVDVALSRGPWSRYVSTIGDIVRPDKPTSLKLMNLLTGVKSSTVDTEKARMIDMVNAQRERLEAMPEIRQTSHFYLAPKYEGTPIEESRRDQLGLLNALQGLQKKLLEQKDRQADTRK